MASKDKEYLLKDRPGRALMTFALPIMIGNLCQQLYQTADSVIVGRIVGQNALASIGASAALTNVFICLATGAGLGASVLIGRHFGARRYDKMKQMISTSLISMLVMSILLGIIGILFSGWVLGALGTPQEVLPQAVLYLRVYFAGFVFLFMYNMISSIFQALGRSDIPLGLLIFSSVLNVGLDIWMVAYLHTGVFGAALATLIAQGVSALLGLYILRKQLRSFVTEQPYRFFDGADLKALIYLAVPSMVQQSTVAIGMTLVQAVVNSFGAQALAGYSAAVRIENLAFVPLTATASAYSTYVSQNYGAGNYKRITQGFVSAMKIDAAFAVVICAVFEVFSGRLATLFLGADGSRIAYDTATGYLMFLGWFFFLLGLKTLADSALRGMGYVWRFLIANLINLGIRVVVSWGFASTVGMHIIWQIIPVGWTVGFLISYFGFRQKRNAFPEENLGLHQKQK